MGENNEDNNRNANQRQNLAKQPLTFTIDNNFSTWFKQFRNYLDICQVPNNNRYQTLLSFLDPESFLTVENLNLTADERADIQDNATYIRIRDALKRNDSKIPPAVELKYRKQKPDETIEQFASRLETLALDAYPEDQNIRQNVSLIQSFITGVSNDELGIKLLSENFDNLQNAVQFAARHAQALQTRRFIKTESDFRPALEKVYNTSHTAPKERETQAEVVNKVEYQPKNTVQANQAQPNQAQAQTYNPVTPGINHNISNYGMPNRYNYINQQPQYNGSMNPFYDNQFQNRNTFLTNNQFPFYQNKNSMMANTPHYSNMRQTRMITCYFCNKAGHKEKDCYSKSRQQNNAKFGFNSSGRNERFQSVRFCNYCNKRGHNAETCWFLNSKPGQDNHQAQNPQNQKTSNLNPFRPN